ncbi:hypothetical protein [Pedobacter steynii]
MNIKVDKIYYSKFLATNANADLLLTENGIAIKNVSVKHSGGSVSLNGSIAQKGSTNNFKLNTVITNVDIKNFFYSFNNFGMKTLTSKNLRGYLFLLPTYRALLAIKAICFRIHYMAASLLI